MVTAAQRESRRRAVRRRLARRQIQNIVVMTALGVWVGFADSWTWGVGLIIFGLVAVLLDEFTSWMYDLLSDNNFDETWEYRCKSWFKKDPTNPSIEEDQ